MASKMNSIKDIEARLNEEIKLREALKNDIKASQTRSDILQQQKNKLMQNASYAEKLEIKGIILSEYKEIDVAQCFNTWWANYLKVYSKVYMKNNVYYGAFNDEFKKISIINSYNKNINDLTYKTTISYDHNTKTTYLYEDNDKNQVYFNGEFWVTIE
jgi:hypothetical protein